MLEWPELTLSGRVDKGGLNCDSNESYVRRQADAGTERRSRRGRRTLGKFVFQDHTRAPSPLLLIGPRVSTAAEQTDAVYYFPPMTLLSLLRVSQAGKPGIGSVTSARVCLCV